MGYMLDKIDRSVTRGELIVDEYSDGNHKDGDSAREVRDGLALDISDVICDLLHTAESHSVSPESVIDRARFHFDAEQTEADEEEVNEL